MTTLADPQVKAEAVTPPPADSADKPTIWGLNPLQLHDRYWAARGVQVVRQGTASEIVEAAELYLLTPASLLVAFDLRPLLDRLAWLEPEIMLLRLRDARHRPYHEKVVLDDKGRFDRIVRQYGDRDVQLARVAITTNRHLARQWQLFNQPGSAWRELRRRIPRHYRAAMPYHGMLFDVHDDADLANYVRHLIEHWPHPDATIEQIEQRSPGVWTHVTTKNNCTPRAVGPVWIGAGRTIPDGDMLGPAVLWDDPNARPQVPQVLWEELEPMPTPTPGTWRNIEPPHHHSAPIYNFCKRIFDIVFALFALGLVLPIFPFIMLAIYLEDGRPFFFAHERETRGGKTFPCLKFRSMRKDADKIKAQLAEANQADGPQFYIEDDPRITRVGRFLRRYQLDELPQFLNVLVGHMSMVGPRPSPRAENQCCPPWREARLSVRPGITGLWQVMRTRQQGQDFQEWIKYDMQYVEKANFLLDLWIIGMTIKNIFRG